MTTSSMPASTMPQFSTMDRTISRASGRCLRARNSSVSWSVRRMKKIRGTIRHPMKKGIRQPQSATRAGAIQVLSP